MKKALKFAPLCALLLAAVSFILLMATSALTRTSSSLLGSVTEWFGAMTVIFGKGPYTLGGLTLQLDGTLAWNALLAWIFILAALVLLLCSSAAVFSKNKTLGKLSGLSSLLAGGLLIVGGVFLFFTVPAFASANSLNLDGFNLSAGWLISAILAIAGGAVSLCPAVLALVK